MPIVGILDENNLKHKLIQFSSSIQKNEEQREIKWRSNWQYYKFERCF